MFNADDDLQNVLQIKQRSILATVSNKTKVFLCGVVSQGQHKYLNHPELLRITVEK